MSAGPLRQTVAVLGLLGLVPILLQLAGGTITPEDAALRGAAVALVVWGLGYVARVTLSGLLRRVERRSSDVEEEGALGVETGGGER
jgi:hypothetical protein